MIKELLARGADPLQDLNNDGGSTPLFMINEPGFKGRDDKEQYWLDNAFLLISSATVIERIVAVSHCRQQTIK